MSHLVTLEGNEYRGCFEAHEKQEILGHGDGVAHGPLVEFRGWEAEALITHLDERRAVIISAGIGRSIFGNEPRPGFLEVLLGRTSLQDRVVDRKKYIDAVLEVVVQRSLEQERPIPRVHFSMWEEHGFRKPDLDPERLVEQGIVLRPDGQRSLPFSASP